MARRLRIEYPGAIYHVTIRGVERRRIFVDDADRRRFLERLESTSNDCGIRLFLYCLMFNHAHFLLETPAANLGQFMHRLQTAYTVYFNLRHSRAGHLMQGRYGARLVEGDDYLLKLSRYVHLNPVFVGKWRNASLAERRQALRNYP
jgi:putative transposase